MTAFSDSNYHFILRQCLESISELQERWPTSLCSSSRYTNQAEVAIWAADTITGAPGPFLRWLAPLVIDEHDNADDEDIWEPTGLDSDFTESDLNSEQIALSDVLEVDNSDDPRELELEAETLPSVMLHWETPDVRSFSMINPV